MVNLTINGIAVSVPENTTILEAAKSVNIHIPNLCYKEKVHQFGSCRICVVEVEGAKNAASLLPGQGHGRDGGAYQYQKGAQGAARIV